MTSRGRTEGEGGGAEALMPLLALGLATLVSLCPTCLACADFQGYAVGEGAVHRDKVGEATDECVCGLSVWGARWTPRSTRPCTASWHGTSAHEHKGRWIGNGVELGGVLELF